MKIRRATIEDAAALAEFNIKMALETEAIELIPGVITAGVETMINNPVMGLYRKLYEQVKTLAEAENNVCGFRLYVEHDNYIAQETYRSLNMEETSYKLFEELKADTRYRKT